LGGKRGTRGAGRDNKKKRGRKGKRTKTGAETAIRNGTRKEPNSGGLESLKKTSPKKACGNQPNAKKCLTGR